MATPEQIAEFHRHIKPDSLWQKIDLLILCCASVAPAMDLSGFGDILPDWPLPVWVVLSGIVGMFVGFTYYPRWRYGLVGIFPGMLAGPSVLLLTYLYTLPRERVYKAEMALVWIVGLAPWAFIYYLAMRFIVLANAQTVPASTAAPPTPPTPRLDWSGQPPTQTQAASHALPGANQSWSGTIWALGGVVAVVALLFACLFFLRGKPPHVPMPPQPAPIAALPKTQQPKLSEQDIGKLLSDLESSDKRIQREALRRLLDAVPTEEYREQVAARLIEFLNDSDFVIRHTAAQTLATWGTKNSVPALIEALGHDDFIIRRHAIEALGKLQDARAAEPLVGRLAVSADRTQAISALRAMGKAAESAVLTALDNNDVFVRMEACKILEAIGTAQSLSKLESAASDPNGLVSAAAKRAIQSIRNRT